MLSEGVAEGPILALNLNTTLSAAGTEYWPNFEGKILLLEDMEAPLSSTERSLQHLKFLNVFDQVQGLIIGKPEFYQQQGAPFGYSDLISEVVGPRSYPIMTEFDCGHTVPMISIPQLTPVRLQAEGTNKVNFVFLDGGVE